MRAFTPSCRTTRLASFSIVASLAPSISIRQIVQSDNAGYCRMSQIRFFAKTTLPAPTKEILIIFSCHSDQLYIIRPLGWFDTPIAFAELVR